MHNIDLQLQILIIVCTSFVLTYFSLQNYNKDNFLTNSLGYFGWLVLFLFIYICWFIFIVIIFTLTTLGFDKLFN